MNFKQALVEINRLGMVIRQTDNEYRVNFRYGEERTAYYTTDLEDALDTAKAMAKEKG